MKKTYPLIALIIYTIVFVIISNSDTVFALDSFPKGPHHKIMEQLTEEQQQEVKARLKELWESGASREEIHAEVTDMLKEFGVEVPEDFKGLRGRRDPRPGRGFMEFADQLTEDQINALEEKIETLHKEGASPEKIHTEITKKLRAYGVDVPDDFEGLRGKKGPRPDRGFLRFSDELTDAQRATIREKVKSMHEDGASREEIHTEIGNLFREYGIELPDDFGHHREIMENLNKEQRKALRVKIREMRKNDATPKEIRDEISKMLQEFGIRESDDQTNQPEETSGESLSIRAYPNPFNPETNIEYHLKSNALVAIHIYDIQGKLVKSLGGDYRQAGTYDIKWDGLNNNGTQVPSGIYFVRITAGDETLNHRIVMMK